MQNGDQHTWQRTSPPSAADDPVEAALGLEQAKLSCGPCVFDFAKARSPHGELVLTERADLPGFSCL